MLNLNLKLNLKLKLVPIFSSALLLTAYICVQWPTSSQGKDIVLRSLVPTFDKLPARQVLKGSVGQTEDLGRLVNLFGYETQVDSKGDTRIGYVKPYTAAWRGGLSAGDKVLGNKVQMPEALLTIERAGKKYSCLMQTKQNLPITLKAKTTENKIDAEILADFAIVMLIDSSASMQTTDCPGNISRWQWCKEHVKDLYVAEKIAAAKSIGGNQSKVSIITFDSNFRSHRNCSTAELPRIFQDSEPSGETYLAPAIADAFALVRNQLAYGKPAMLAVVTDGRLNDGDRIKNTIVAQVNSLAKPELLSIVFLEVGTPDKLLKELDKELIKQGAKADVITVVPFSQATSKGLVHSLADTVPKPKAAESTALKGSAVSTENKAKAAISAHIFGPPPKEQGHKPAPLVVPKTIVIPQGAPAKHAAIKAHPSGTSLDAKTGVLPQEVDEKEQVLKRNANRTYP